MTGHAGSDNYRELVASISKYSRETPLSKIVCAEVGENLVTSLHAHTVLVRFICYLEVCEVSRSQ